MAHFAELDENNIVTRVLVVNNEDILDGEGQESESVGVSFLSEFVWFLRLLGSSVLIMEILDAVILE